jgi:hypothetical protein
MLAAGISGLSSIYIDVFAQDENWYLVRFAGIQTFIQIFRF